MSSKKSFFIKLSCALGAFVLGFAFAVMPFFSSTPSYADSSKFGMENFSQVTYLNKFFGENFDSQTAIDTDNIFRVDNKTYMILNGSVRTYSLLDVNTKIWGGGTSSPFGFNPSDAGGFWHDNDNNYYYSLNSTNYLYNRSTGSFSSVTFTGRTQYYGYFVFNLPDRVLLYDEGLWFELDSSSRNWSQITISFPSVSSVARAGFAVVDGKLFYKGLTTLTNTGVNDLWLLNGNTFELVSNSFPNTATGSSFWTDGYNWYCDNRLFNTTDYSLTTVNWSFAPFMSTVYGDYIWTDGYHIYYSTGVSNENAVLYNNIYYQGYNLGYEAGYSAGYNTGYLDGINGTGEQSSYDRGYEAGYNAGVATNSGYNNGYDTGYNLGYNQGYNAGQSNGYNSGYNTGSTDGYNLGYNAGVEAGTDYSFLGLMGAVIDAPIQAFSNLFNFDLFGTNIKNLLLALFTGSIIVVIVKFALGGK